jgi:hypothetical protein
MPGIYGQPLGIMTRHAGRRELRSVGCGNRDRLAKVALEMVFFKTSLLVFWRAALDQCVVVCWAEQRQRLPECSGKPHAIGASSQQPATSASGEQENWAVTFLSAHFGAA